MYTVMGKIKIALGVAVITFGLFGWYKLKQKQKMMKNSPKSGGDSSPTLNPQIIVWDDNMNEIKTQTITKRKERVQQKDWFDKIFDTFNKLLKLDQKELIQLITKVGMGILIGYIILRFITVIIRKF